MHDSKSGTEHRQPLIDTRGGQPGLGLDDSDVAITSEAGQPHATLDMALTDVELLLARFVHFRSRSDAVAITLWIALAHCWAQFDSIIYLVLSSAVKRTGKTRTLDIIEQLVPNAWRAIRPTEAVTFRRIDRDRPTMLLDEYDTIFNDRVAFEGLRAILNAGNRRGTQVPRAVSNGHGYDVVDFDVYCPKVLAGIGQLPDTVEDRAIKILMVRRAPDEPIERLRVRDLERLAAPIRDALAANLTASELASIVPNIPVELNDRAADGWEPLLAIAELAGGTWPERARSAAIALSSDEASGDDLPITLLSDIRIVFTERGVDRLWTAELIDGLVKIEGSPWAQLRGRTITPTQVAKILRPFSIRPEQLKLDGTNRWGYVQGAFADAWRRYLPSPVAGAATSTTVTTNAALGHVGGQVPVVAVASVAAGNGEQGADVGPAVHETGEAA